MSSNQQWSSVIFLAKSIAKRRSQKRLLNRSGLRTWVVGLKDDAESRGVKIESQSSTMSPGTTFQKAKGARRHLTISFRFAPDATEVWEINIRLLSGMLGLARRSGRGGPIFFGDKHLVPSTNRSNNISNRRKVCEQVSAESCRRKALGISARSP